MDERYGALETGGTWCVLGIGTADGELLEVDRFPTERPDETLERCAAWLRARGSLRRVGIGSFGPVIVDPAARDWGTVTTTPKEGWRGTAVGPYFADALDTEIVLDTDVGVAALAEQRWGAGRGCSSMAYITIGTGIGAGLIIDGRIVRGLQHPEFGHVPVRRDRETDAFAGICPYHGDCLEGLASGPALRARWDTDPSTLPDDHEAWVLETGYLTDALRILTYTMSPERVILGGGVGRRPGLVERLRDRLAEAMAGYLDPPELCRPGLADGQSGVRGALALAIGQS
jgi:fructokinase